MDEDLAALTREQLVDEVKRLRNGIRTHRDSTGHALCWHHPALWGLLPERTDPLPTVPAWPEFCAAASATANRWTTNCPTRRALMRRISRDLDRSDVEWF